MSPVVRDYCGEAGHHAWLHYPEDTMAMYAGLHEAPAVALDSDCVPVYLGDWLFDADCACPVEGHTDDDGCVCGGGDRFAVDVCPLCRGTGWDGHLHGYYCCHPDCRYGYVAAEPLEALAREVEARRQRQLARSAGPRPIIRASTTPPPRTPASLSTSPTTASRIPAP